MKDYQKRVIAEKTELDIRIIKLTTFIHSDKFSVLNMKERDMLHHQLIAMMEYDKCLCMRIDNFKKMRKLK